MTSSLGESSCHWQRPPAHDSASTCPSNASSSATANCLPTCLQRLLHQLQEGGLPGPPHRVGAKALGTPRQLILRMPGAGQQGRQVSSQSFSSYIPACISHCQGAGFIRHGSTWQQRQRQLA
jgi:hypothetical protein